jgi:hypothetical protein
LSANLPLGRVEDEFGSKRGSNKTAPAKASASAGGHSFCDGAEISRAPSHAILRAIPEGPSLDAAPSGPPDGTIAIAIGPVAVSVMVLSAIFVLGAVILVVAVMVMAFAVIILAPLVADIQDEII